MPESKYNRYLVTEPVKGRTVQSLTLVNEKLIPGCNLDIMFNWIIKMPEYNAERAAGHSHDYDEVILNIGGDPQNPEYLGGEIEGFMGDEKHILNTTSAIYIPRNVQHGVVRWTRYERPHIQMAIKLSGSGS